MNIIEKHLPQDCYSPSPLIAAGILIHFVSARNTYPDDRYNPQHCWDIFARYKVSAHYMVLRNGDIWRLVPENKVAWHAGKSRFRGRENLNNMFVGVEFVGVDDDDFTDVQYYEGASLVFRIAADYGIKTSWIKGHEDVSDRQIRHDPKDDPGPHFDWIRFGGLLYQLGLHQ